MEDIEQKFDFVMIGAPKCASTWIYECLKEHPEIALASFKDEFESGYFVKNGLSDKDKERYEEFFSKNESKKVLGELNESYISGDEGIAQRIRENNSDMKIIISLKNPVDIVYSNYLCWNSLRDKDWESFKDAVEKEPVLTKNGYYYKHLKKYYETFPEENILVVLSENIKEDPTQFIQNIYNFLEVDSDFEPEGAEVKAGATMFKITKLGRFVHRNVIKLLKRTTVGKKIRSSNWVRRHYYSLGNLYAKANNVEKPPIKDKTRNYLKDLYREDINQLEELIGEDLTHWK